MDEIEKDAQYEIDDEDRRIFVKFFNKIYNICLVDLCFCFLVDFLLLLL